MSRSRLGRANMAAVSKEELVLAEMIANAEEHLLKFVTHCLNVDDVEGLIVPTAECACAIGAHEAFKPAITEAYDDEDEYGVYSGFTARTGLDFRRVYEGNDHPLDYASPECGPSYDVGAAYHAYHQADPSAPVINT